jgi:hypothetical protein
MTGVFPLVYRGIAMPRKKTYPDGMTRKEWLEALRERTQERMASKKERSLERQRNGYTW